LNNYSCSTCNLSILLQRNSLYIMHIFILIPRADCRQGRSWVFVAGGSRQSRRRRRREFDSRRYPRYPTHKFSHRICTNLKGPPDRRWGVRTPGPPRPATPLTVDLIISDSCRIFCYALPSATSLFKEIFRPKVTSENTNKMFALIRMVRVIEGSAHSKQLLGLSSSN
jgi:hypothetical protein